MTELTGKLSPSQTTMLTVRVGVNLFALPLAVIEEVLPALPIESLPGCPSFVRGVVCVGGHLMPVLDAAERLGIREHQRPDEPHIVCLRQQARLVGLEFDEALDLIEIGLDDWLTAGDLGAEAGFLRGVVERDGSIIRLLDPEKLLGRDEVIALQQATKTRESTQ